MIDRRNLLAALSCVAALGTAELLRPRRQVILMPSGTKLKDVVPQQVGPWSVGEGGDIVIPRVEGMLAWELYNDQLARAYRDATETHPDVMVLAAYGASQSDALQLHRPEICYPSFGFEIVGRRFVGIPVRGSADKVPGVALTAKSSGRIEDIVYWTRVGDSLPQTGGEQRRELLKAALAGYVGDGMLFRASAIRLENDEPLFDDLITFLATLISELKPVGRLALLGRRFDA